MTPKILTPECNNNTPCFGAGQVGGTWARTGRRDMDWGWARTGEGHMDNVWARTGKRGHGLWVSKDRYNVISTCSCSPTVQFPLPVLSPPTVHETSTSSHPPTVQFPLPVLSPPTVHGTYTSSQPPPVLPTHSPCLCGMIYDL